MRLLRDRLKNKVFAGLAIPVIQSKEIYPAQKYDMAQPLPLGISSSRQTKPRPTSPSSRGPKLKQATPKAFLGGDKRAPLRVPAFFFARPATPHHHIQHAKISPRCGGWRPRVDSPVSTLSFGKKSPASHSAPNL